MKTKLSTDSMEDVFHYNSGSLLQALNPDQTLVDLSDEEWVGDLTDDFKAVVSTDNGLYGAPWGTSFAGAVMYNKKVYESLGLEVPTTWDEFIANSEKIKADGNGVAPILQSFGDTWTSQLFVLGDFANVTAQDPDWAEEYTANDKAKYVEEPAFAGFDQRRRGAREGSAERGLRVDDQRAGDGCPRHRHGCAVPDAVGDDRGSAAGQPRQGRRHRRVRTAGCGRRRHVDHDVAAERDLHREDHRGRQARRGEEVRGVRELGGRLRRCRTRPARPQARTSRPRARCPTTCPR